MPAYDLQKPDVRQRKLQSLERHPATPLTRFTREIRSERGLSEEVPWFDPDDGGVWTRMLLLFEAPGPRAVQSGFISSENPDPTARNVYELRAEVGIPREMVLHWNIVPWFVDDSEGRIRSVSTQELYAGASYLERLLKLLPDLRVVVAMGRKAQRGLQYVSPQALDGLTVISTWHPSGRVFNPKPHLRAEVLEALKRGYSLAKGV